MEVLLKFALNNVIVVRCNLLSFGVNFDKILPNKNIQKRIFFNYNNDIAAARVELWSSSTNAKDAESSSTNYILCKKQISINAVSFKKCYNTCDMSCIHGRYTNLILFGLLKKKN